MRCSVPRCGTPVFRRHRRTRPRRVRRTRTRSRDRPPGPARRRGAAGSTPPAPTAARSAGSRRAPQWTWRADGARRVRVARLRLRPGLEIAVRPGETLVVGRESPDDRIATFLDRFEGVSRRHLELRVGDRQVVVTDLDSTNGTYLDEAPVEQVDARAGRRARAAARPLRRGPAGRRRRGPAVTVLRVAAVTHVGAVRTENQDCLLVDGWVSAADGTWSRRPAARCGRPGVRRRRVRRPRRSRGRVGGVADRGADPGRHRLAGHRAGHRPRRIERAAVNVQTASDDVRGLRGLGTTVAGVALGPSGFCVFNVGDSSVFRAMGGYVGELTVPDRHVGPAGSGRLSQSLSIYTAVPAPHVETFPIPRPLRLLVCSDGLTDTLDHEDLGTALGDDVGVPGRADAAAQALLDAALRAGAPDNVSLVVVDVLPGAEAGGDR